VAAGVKEDSMAYADLGEFRMFYTDEGDGPPILLVHGWTCDGSDWSWQIPAFRADHRVITVDLRGHGRSGVTEGGYSPINFAHDIAKLLEQIGTGPVVAMGHSLGGATVVALAVEHPELVRAVVPVDAGYGFGDGMGPVIEELLAGLASAACHDVATGFFKHFYPPACPPYLAVLHERRLRGMEPDVIAKTFTGLISGPGQFARRADSEAYLQRVKVPALAFRAGEQDPSGSAAWERAQFAHPQSKAVAWEGTGHFLHQERPAEFNAIVLAWMRDCLSVS
jgi:pimeloyl-ACP methyl ester carboxylesterase